MSVKIPPPLNAKPSVEDLITGFYQKGAGNCVSIAIIKASLMAFSPKSVFASVSKTNNTFSIVMRDSETVYEISEDEVNKAKDMSYFSGENTVLLHHAHFMFAAMCKRAQLENNDGVAAQSFEHAIKSLNNGEHWNPEGPHWLGIKSFVDYGPSSWYSFFSARRYLRKHIAAMGQSPKHTWFCSKGKNDLYGKIRTSFPFFTKGAISLNLDGIDDI